MHGEHHSEHRSLRFAIELDDPAVVADNLGDQRQAETAAFRLGGDEWFEQVRLDILGMPSPLS